MAFNLLYISSLTTSKTPLCFVRAAPLALPGRFMGAIVRSNKPAERWQRRPLFNLSPPNLIGFVLCGFEEQRSGHSGGGGGDLRGGGLQTGLPACAKDEAERRVTQLNGTL